MPDFNKGDFTQQGVAGHVNANLRLNEKRLVNIDMTSNENDEGCTIAGTVTDLLNDKVYPIGSAPSGNIEITENGENINVAQYALADVNVSGGGGGDFIGASVTLKTIETINEAQRFIRFEGLIISSGNGLKEANNRISTTHDEATYNYLAVIDPNTQQPLTIYDEDEALITVVLTGDAEFVEEEPDGVQIEISGDCTISVTVHE